MSEVTAVNGSARRQMADDGAPAATVSTMPESQLDLMQDQLAMVFAMLSEMQRDQSNLSQQQVLIGRANQEIARQKQQEALEAAKRAARARDKGGIMGFLKEDIGVLGVVGLATFNYGVVAADIALHKTGLVDNMKLDVADGFCAAVARVKPELLVADILVRKLDITPDEVKKALDEIGLGESTPGISDEDVKPIVDKMVAANLLVAGTAASILTAGSTTALVVALVAAAMSTGAMASAAMGGPEELTIGLAIGGAVLSLGGGFVSGAGGAANATGDAARISAARAAAASINGISGTIGGIDQAIATKYQNDFDRHDRDATAARQMLMKIERLLDSLIDSLRDGAEAHKRTTETVTQLLETHDNTLTTTAAAIKA